MIEEEKSQEIEDAESQSIGKRKSSEEEDGGDEGEEDGWKKTLLLTS